MVQALLTDRHARYADPVRAKLAIDQCAEVGFEMVILSFGSGFDIENTIATISVSIPANGCTWVLVR